MSRELKFRVFYGESRGLHYFSLGEVNRYPSNIMNWPVMQFTGLKDKNGSGSICFYEGDIVDLHGNLLGNRYEQIHLLENKSNLLIEGIGTKNWRSTEEEAMARGLGYAQ